QCPGIVARQRLHLGARGEVRWLVARQRRPQLGHAAILVGELGPLLVVHSPATTLSASLTVSSAAAANFTQPAVRSLRAYSSPGTAAAEVLAGAAAATRPISSQPRDLPWLVYSSLSTVCGSPAAGF